MDARRFHVNKKTHRIRFENETEDSVEIVIEPKEPLTPKTVTLEFSRSPDFYKSVKCEVVDGVVIIPEFTLESTDDEKFDAYFKEQD